MEMVPTAILQFIGHQVLIILNPFPIPGTQTYVFIISVNLCIQLCQGWLLHPLLDVSISFLEPLMLTVPQITGLVVGGAALIIIIAIVSIICEYDFIIITSPKVTVHS